MTDPIKPIELIIDELRVAETAFKPSFDIEDNETTQLTLKVNQSSPIDQQVIYLAQMIVSHNPFKLKNCDSGLITDILSTIALHSLAFIPSKIETHGKTSI